MALSYLPAIASTSHASASLPATASNPASVIFSVAVVAMLPVVGRFLARTCGKICAARSQAGAVATEVVQQEYERQENEQQEDEILHLELHKMDGERLGFVIRPTGGDGFRVEYVNGEGVLARWNAEHPKTQVRAGDLILEVNGESDRTGLVMEAWNSSLIRMTVQRSRYPEYSPTESRVLSAKASVNDYPRVRGADLQGIECAICLEAFTSDSFGVSLPCKHCFHQSCVSRWLADTNSCPCCRLDLPMFDYVYQRHD